MEEKEEEPEEKSEEENQKEKKCLYSHRPLVNISMKKASHRGTQMQRERVWQEKAFGFNCHHDR